jgi:hypothetical protein
MAEESFDARLVAAMGDMSNPTRSSVATVPTRGGSKYTYKYETLEQVLAIVKPALQAHGIGMSQGSAWSDVAGTYVLQTKVFDETESRILDERPLCATTDAQAYGGFETYMRRYALRSAFGLCGEDDDGASATSSARNAARKQKRREPAEKKPDRKKMLDACAELSAKCVENGMNPGATEGYMRSHFGVESIEELTDDQIIEYGKYLRQMEEQSRGLGKDDTDEHQQG